MGSSPRPSRRNLIQMAGLAGASALSLRLLTARPADAAPSDGAAVTTPRGNYGALGANFNGVAADLRVRELQLGPARWVRGFFPVPDAADGDVRGNPNVSMLLTLAARDYKTILTLKFPFNTSPLPVPGSAEMDTTLSQVDKVLDVALNHIDILEIGNEPFIETRPADRGPALSAFYEAVAQHIIGVQRARFGSSSLTRLYMGALNRLDLPENLTPTTERWMDFVRTTPEIDGVDIHPHVPSPEAVQPFLDYVIPRLRADQTFLVTEFSLVWYWKAHLTDPVPASYAEEYNIGTTTQVWQVIRSSIESPFPQSQWDAFLGACTWYQSQRYFLRDQVQKFRATGRLAVATYGYQQDVPMTTSFGPAKPPWLLNTVFANHTVEDWANGTEGRGYGWLEQFQELQIPS